MVAVEKEMYVLLKRSRDFQRIKETPQEQRKFGLAKGYSFARIIPEGKYKENLFAAVSDGFLPETTPAVCLDLNIGMKFRNFN